ncbi:MAG: hypothetical protein WDO73_00590 [Ignavibacteriota bacterium]
MSNEAKKAAAVSGAASETQSASLLDQIVEEGRLARDPESKDRGKDMVREFVAQFLEGNMGLSRDSEAMINAPHRADRSPDLAAVE